MAALLQEEYGLAAVDLKPVHGGTDDSAQVWRAWTSNGLSYAVKTGRSRSLDLDVPGVPRPLQGGSLHVTRWIDGDPGPARLVHWRALGRLLARVHTLTADAPRIEYDHRRQAAVAHDVDQRLTPELAQVWDRSVVDRLIKRADTLAAALADRPREDVLCHTDPHLGNLLLDGEDVWLIDWDDARLAPREHDLLFVLGGVLVEQVTEAEQAAFFDGYGPVEVDAELLAYARCVRALEELDWGCRVLEPERPEEERAMALRIVRWQFSAVGLVRLAAG